MQHSYSVFEYNLLALWLPDSRLPVCFPESEPRRRIPSGVNTPFQMTSAQRCGSRSTSRSDQNTVELFEAGSMTEELRECWTEATFEINKLMVWTLTRPLQHLFKNVLQPVCYRLVVLLTQLRQGGAHLLVWHIFHSEAVQCSLGE